MVRAPDVVIFDLDGTLALIDHRRHLVEGKDKDWDKFFAECKNDLPNWPVIRALHALIVAGVECWIVSGRSEAVRDMTVKWLNEHVWDTNVTPLIMRPVKDTTPDDELKLKWLTDGTLPRDRILCSYDDRDKVVKMWRENGVSCFQVAPGSF